MSALILSTYDDWFSDISIKWNMKDYMDVLEKSSLEPHLSAFLESNGRNILNEESMPFIDLGDKPNSYNPRQLEADQIYVIPSSKYPNKLVVKYADCKPLYVSRNLKEKHKKCDLNTHLVTVEDI